MGAYYQLLDRHQTQDGTVVANYHPFNHAQGAWNSHEQHMAPVGGIICLELEKFAPRSDMRFARISYDIFGLIELTDFTITTRNIRLGKTIELIESIMATNGKTLVVARAWRISFQDTNSIAAIEDQVIASHATMPMWDGLQRWPGGYINSLITKANDEHRPGKGIIWITNELEMVQDHKTSDFVRLIGMVDTANGAAPRKQDKLNWSFPNLDLQIHLYRQPTGKWLGLETTQQYGTDGIGLTSSILHDINGPFGHSEQILTLRKRP